MSDLNLIWSIVNSLLIIATPVIGKIWADGKIEKVKSSLSKKELIHKLQFEHEFKIYKSLWKKIANLSKATAELLPIMDLTGLDKEEKLNNIQKALNESSSVIIDNTPFYSKEIYEYANEIYKISLTEALLFSHATVSNIKDFERAQEKAKELFEISKKIEEAIRNRINRDED